MIQSVSEEARETSLRKINVPRLVVVLQVGYRPRMVLGLGEDLRVDRNLLELRERPLLHHERVASAGLVETAQLESETLRRHKGRERTLEGRTES